MREQHAAGIVICPALGTPRSMPAEVQSWGIPLVVMVRSLGTGSYDYAGSDNERGIEMATQHLVEAGHKRIAFLGGRSGVVYEQRLRGYTRALKDAGLRYDERLVIGSNPSRAGGREAMDALLALKSPPAAAVCYNDITAFGAIVSLGEHGLKPGTDFAILGFDNVIAAEHSNPPLSTIDIRPSELGEHAAATLMARIDNPKLKRQVFLAEPRLLLRQSG
jgi:LacI family transcriptional regulator